MDKSRWMSATLVAAGLYNLVWGAGVILFPQAAFRWAGLPEINHAPVWQAVGMIVGVYGVGYLVAATNPLRHWPIVLVGLLGKILGPIGMAFYVVSGQFPLGFALICLFNDLIWWAPFAMILYQAFRWHSERGRFELVPSWGQLLRESRSQRGQSLAALSAERPTMVVFLRHSGCTFCRRVMADLGEVRQQLNDMPVHVVVVHMGSPLDGTTILAKYEVEYWHHISDPFCIIYRGFGLQRGRFGQLFSWKVLLRGLNYGLIGGQGIGKLEGDSFFLPGVFVLHHGRIIIGQPAEDATQRPDFVAIANQALELSAGVGPNPAYVDSKSSAGCRLETV